MTKPRKQQQYVTGKLYHVIGPSGRVKMLKYIGKGKMNKHEFLMFQHTKARIK